MLPSKKSLESDEEDVVSGANGVSSFLSFVLSLLFDFRLTAGAFRSAFRDSPWTPFQLSRPRLPGREWKI